MNGALQGELCEQLWLFRDRGQIALGCGELLVPGGILLKAG